MSKKLPCETCIHNRVCTTRGGSNQDGLCRYYQQGFIKIKYRPMTDEEIRKYESYWGTTLDDDEKVMFDCLMPDDGEEILIATTYGISQDICEYDPDEGYGLDTRGDWEDVWAWMPCPQYEANDDSV